MARNFTLAALRTKVRQRADIEDSNFIDDTELNGYISASYAVLYQELVNSGLAYFASSEDFAVVAGTASYAVHASHMSTVGVDWQEAAGKYRPLRRLMPKEVDWFPERATPSIGYILNGVNVVLYPTPGAAGTYRHRYVPAPADLTADADVVNGVAGWEEIIVNDAARKCLMKEESDTFAIERELDRQWARLEVAKAARYVEDGPRVVDVDDADVTDYSEFQYDFRRL